MDGPMNADFSFDYTSTGLYVAREDGWLPFTVPVLRDANATAGTWWQAITLNHRGVVWDGAEIYAFEPELHDMLGEYVPLFEGDPERAVWRRRKWWGDGPVKPFSPWGAWRTQWTFTIPATLRESTSYPCRSVEF
jgi:hypothetical protein